MTPSKKVHRPCPICCNEVCEVLHNQRFKLPKDKQFLPKTYDVVACLKCGFVYADTEASQQDYNRYYVEFSKYEANINAPGSGTTRWDAQRLKRTADDINMFLPDKNAAILDIGSGKGGLLAALKNKNYYNLTALDPCVECVLYINEKYGIQAIADEVFSLNLNLNDNNSLREKFDFIILSHVIEHLCDLQVMIKNIFLLVKKGGVVYVEVPDASRYSDYYISPYHYFDIEHINHFDEHSLQNLFIQNCFEQVFCGKKEISVSDKYKYPAIYGLYRKVDVNIIPHAIIPNFKVRDEIIRYVNCSHMEDQYPELDELVISQESIIVWGIGSFTLRMLENTPLGKCNIFAFIDNDAKKQGLKLMDVRICSPDILNQNKMPVVVSSALFSDEIVSELKQMGISGKIIVIK